MKKTNNNPAGRFLRATEIERDTGMSRYFLDRYAKLGFIRKKKTGKGRGCAVFYSEDDARKVWDSLRDGYDPEIIADWDEPPEGGEE